MCVFNTHQKESEEEKTIEVNDLKQRLKKKKIEAGQVKYAR